MTKEERLERLKRKIKENPERSKPGFFTAADLDGTVRREHWRKSMTRRNERGEMVFRDTAKRTAVFDPPPIVKRTAQERVESLTKRLLQHIEDTYVRTGTPSIPQDLLDMIKAEYWAMGDPVKAEGVSAEAVRAIAAEFMKRAEREAK
jgi:hypothetical protein